MELDGELWVAMQYRLSQAAVEAHLAGDLDRFDLLMDQIYMGMLLRNIPHPMEAAVMAVRLVLAEKS